MTQWMYETMQKVKYFLLKKSDVGHTHPIADVLALQNALNDINQMIEDLAAGIPTPPITQVQSDWAESSNVSAAYIKNKPSLFSGSYADLSGKPTLFDGVYSSLTGKPTLFSGDYNDLGNKPTLFDGAYSSLSGKPTIPDAQIQSDWGQSNNTFKDYIKNKPTLFDGVYSSLSGKPTLFSGNYADLAGKPTLFSGAYADLSGKPYIPFARTNSAAIDLKVMCLTGTIAGGGGNVVYQLTLDGTAGGTAVFTNIHNIVIRANGNQVYAYNPVLSNSNKTLTVTCQQLNLLALGLGNVANGTTVTCTIFGS